VNVYNELEAPISTTKRQGNTSGGEPFITLVDLAASGFKLQISARKAGALPLGIESVRYDFIHKIN